MRGRGRTHIARLLTALGVSTALLVSLALPATAAPKYPGKDDVSKARDDADDSAAAAANMRKKLAAAQATLDRLDTEVAIAVEAYNGAVYKLSKAKKTYTKAKARSKQTATAVEKARGDVASVASRAYAGSGTAEYVSLFGSEDPAGVADGASMLSVLSEQRGGAYDRLAAAKVVQNIVRKQTKHALAKQRAETKRVAATKRAAQAKLATQQSVLDRVASLQSKLAERADEDAQDARNLAAERRDGIAEARRIAAAKAAAEARKRAREARERAQAAQAAQQEKPSKPRDNGGSNVGAQSVGNATGGVAAVQYAKAQIGKPYEWAADGPDTFDCSGLTMRAWQRGGVSLPHYSVAQWDQTSRVSLSNLRLGDLVFYADNTNDPSTIHHVGMYIGNGKMVEAPYTGAYVRISSIYRSDLIGAGRP
ncbi:MAG: hypothetical protein GEV07_18385 [Streptosporangiales bacterium]|nr:hypothetical protein [Streptosporangiales bacterium]